VMPKTEGNDKDEWDDEEENVDDTYDNEDPDDTCYENEQQQQQPSIEDPEATLVKMNLLLKDSLGIELEYKSMSVTNLFLPFKHDSEEKKISLSTFGPLIEREPVTSNPFFPKNQTLFVRPSMKRIMKRFTWNEEKRQAMHDIANQWILIGSPGTGKSLLFFLAAVYKASKAKEPVIYLRNSGKSEPISMYYMFPDGTDKVGMYFKRLSKTEQRRSNLENLKQIIDPLWAALIEHTSISPVPLVFLDGPKSNDKDNILEKRYDYLCTSGGFPPLKSEDMLNFSIWVLDAWSKNEMIEALVELHNQDESQATKIYELCGGCMREATTALSERGKGAVRRMFDHAIDDLKNHEFEIISFVAVNQNRNHNRLRSIFVINKKKKGMTDIGNYRQCADSKYVLEKLKFRQGLGLMQRAYMYALKDFKKASLVAAYYERYWHLWFEIKQPCGITYFHDSDNNQPLNTTNQYWVPGIENQANIDAALVYKKTLYAFQYTVRNVASRKEFNEVTFSTKFVSPLLTRIDDIKEVLVLIVSPHKDLKPPKLKECAIKGWGKDVKSNEITFRMIQIMADVESGKDPNFPFLPDIWIRTLNESFQKMQCNIM
jgi:hypothetical protein